MRLRPWPLSHFVYLRAIKTEKEGITVNTNLTERFEISIYEDPVGTYFEYKVQEAVWNDDDCKFLIKIVEAISSSPFLFSRHFLYGESNEPWRFQFSMHPCQV